MDANELNELKKVLESHKLWLIGQESGKRADLSLADLSDIFLSYANLSSANLSSANLSRADLSAANLCKANLLDTNLFSVHLYGANLRGANLSGAKLISADLRSVDLFGINLSGADLSGAYLSGAKNIYTFGPVGKNNRIAYAVKHDNCVMVQLGCFWGTSDQAIDAIRNKYGENSSYESQIKLAVRILQEQEGVDDVRQKDSRETNILFSRNEAV